MTTLDARTLLKTENILGEGPLWHSVHQMLYWVDIEKEVVHAFEPHTQRHREWPVASRVGTIAPSADGKLVLGLHGEVAELDTATGEVTRLVELEQDLPENRCNDGKCDPVGRFWVGTMHLQTKPGTGSLYCIDHSRKVHRVLKGLTISNGMGWSPDGRYMYFIDSHDRYVRRYRFNPDQPVLEGEEIILRFSDEEGLPDGMCVDREGNLWIGFWGGYRVGCYNPETGEHLADVSVPAPHVTSCCFGGKELDTLYITTARDGLDDEQLKHDPLSGSLFVCEPGATGMDAHFFGSVSGENKHA